MNNHWLNKAESTDSSEPSFTVIRYDDEVDAVVEKVLKPTRWDYLCLVCGDGEDGFSSMTAAAEWVEKLQKEFRRRVGSDLSEEQARLPSIVVLDGKTDFESPDAKGFRTQERLEQLGVAVHEVPETCAEATPECVAGEFFKQMAADYQRDRAHVNHPGNEPNEPSPPQPFSSERLGEPPVAARRYAIPPTDLLAAGDAPIRESFDKINEQAERRAGELFDWYKKDETACDEKEGDQSTDDEP